ncbi:MAG: hypothetical protein WC119_02930 [Synergistaceae bacterium]
MQNKFVKLNTKLITATKSAINDEIKRGFYNFSNEVFNVRHLTECPRRIIYRANASEAEEITEEEKKSKFLLDRNIQFTKKKWVDLFERTKKIEILDKDVQAADCNYNIVGMADAIFKCNNLISVLKVDILKPEQYHRAKLTGGLRKQIIELMTVIWLVEVPNGILLCENQEDDEYFMSHIIPYSPILDGIRAKCNKLVEHKCLQRLPKRSYEDRDNSECVICEYKHTCWEKEGDKNNG